MEMITGTNSKNGYDLCVSCGKQTRYPINTPIDARYDYVEGAGQLFEDCSTKTFGLETKLERSKK